MCIPYTMLVCRGHATNSFPSSEGFFGASHTLLQGCDLFAPPSSSGYPSTLTSLKNEASKSGSRVTGVSFAVELNVGDDGVFSHHSISGQFRFIRPVSRSKAYRIVQLARASLVAQGVVLVQSSCDRSIRRHDRIEIRNYERTLEENEAMAKQ